MGEGTHTQTEQDNGSISNPENPPKKKRICELSIISAISLPLFFCFYPLTMLSALLAIISKLQIALSNDRMRGNSWANLIIVLSCIGLLFSLGTSMSGRSRHLAQRVICGTNLKGLGSALVIYAHEYDDQLPTATEWCDLLITNADVSPKSFICPSSDDNHGECSYALNKYAAGKRLSELPPGMIILFETNFGRSESEQKCLLKEREFLSELPELAEENPDIHLVHRSRWNQVGGPEDMICAHENGSNFNYADGHSSFERFIGPEDIYNDSLKGLYWDEAKTQFSISDYISIAEILEYEKPSFPKIVIVIGIIVSVCSLIVISVTHIWKYPFFVILLAICTSGVGYLFGGWAESLYRPEIYKGIGSEGGAGLGLLLSMCYVGILMKFVKRLTNMKSVGQFATSSGMITGMLCSTLLHLALFLLHGNEYKLVFMLIGLPFGITAGAVLGMISFWVISGFYLPELPQVESVNKGESIK